MDPNQWRNQAYNSLVQGFPSLDPYISTEQTGTYDSDVTAPHKTKSDEIIPCVNYNNKLHKERKVKIYM